MINLWALPSQIPKCPPLYQFAFILRCTCKSLSSVCKSFYLDLCSTSSVTSLHVALEVAVPVPLAPSASINLRHSWCLIRFNGLSLIHSSQLLSLLIVVGAVVNFPGCLLCFVYRLSAFSFIHTKDNIFTDPTVECFNRWGLFAQIYGAEDHTHSRVLALFTLTCLLTYSHFLAHSLIHTCLLAHLFTLACSLNCSRLLTHLFTLEFCRFLIRSPLILSSTEKRPSF